MYCLLLFVNEKWSMSGCIGHHVNSVHVRSRMGGGCAGCQGNSVHHKYVSIIRVTQHMCTVWAWILSYLSCSTPAANNSSFQTFCAAKITAHHQLRRSATHTIRGRTKTTTYRPVSTTQVTPNKCSVEREKNNLNLRCGLVCVQCNHTIKGVQVLLTQCIGPSGRTVEGFYTELQLWCEKKRWMLSHVSMESAWVKEHFHQNP